MGIIIVLISYIIGALPIGYLLVRLIKKQDITRIGSGRTGATNAMRAGGLIIGILTSILDVLKGFISVWLARWLMPDAIWLQVFAGVATIVGHNWSIWLYWLSGRFSAGAGTGPNVGAAMAFWPGIGLFVIPLVIFFVLIIGYASLASVVTALAITTLFLVRAKLLGEPLAYSIYGLMTSLVIIWALRPNIRRLLNGTERRVGLFAKKN